MWPWQRQGQAITEPCMVLTRLRDPICFPPGKYREHQPEMMDWPLAPRDKGCGPRGHTLLSEIPATTHVSAKETVSERIGLIPVASCG